MIREDLPSLIPGGAREAADFADGSARLTSRGSLNGLCSPQITRSRMAINQGTSWFA